MLLNEIKQLKENTQFSPQFLSWFKGSKVVDEHGLPLKVYHGSNTDIMKFEREYLHTAASVSQYGAGHYFATSSSTASGYADTRQEGAVVYPVYLSIKKPLPANYVKKLTRIQIKNIMSLSPGLKDSLWNFGDIDYEGYNKVFNDAIDAHFHSQDGPLLRSLHMLSNDIFDGYDHEFLSAITKVLKYDGIVADFDNGGKFYVAFFGNQIKSAIGNTGEYSKESENIHESFNVNLDQAYEIFKKSYEESTGASWSKDKFLSRARNWKFYGDDNGYVSVRPQRSGLYKLVGVAGSPKSIYKGLHELLSENRPIWGMISADMVPMAKKVGFIQPTGYIIKAMMKLIPKSVFGDVDFTVNHDGSLTFQYSDVGDATKYFIANKLYFKEMLATHADKVNDFAMKPILKTLELLIK